MHHRVLAFVLSVLAIGGAAIFALSPSSRAAEAPSVEKRRADLRSGLLDRQAKALQALTTAAERWKSGDRGAFTKSLEEAIAEIDVLRAAEVPSDLRSPSFFLIPPPQKQQLAELRDTLAKRAAEPGAAGSEFPVDAYRAVLDGIAKCLRPPAPLGLDFTGSYTQPIITDQAVGGHASAMGPPPMQMNANEDMGPGERAPVELVDHPGLLTVKTYAGSKTKDHILESGTGGVALFDYDGDGKVDIFIAATEELNDKKEKVEHPAALYHNLGHWKFENVTKKAGVDLPGWGQGVCVGDVDDDGRPDLYVTNYGANFLFRNNGDGTFTEMAAKAGLQAEGWNTGCAFFDADGDGKLDLYVARYMTVKWDEVVNAKRTMKWRGGPDVMAGPVGLPGGADVFFENKGDGTFVEATAAHGLTDTNKAYGYGVVATDYDGDGWTDIFVANDSTPNFLYHNDGKGHFESAGLMAGVALNSDARAQAGMGADSGDYDNDGKLDLVLTTFARDTKTLYHNVGNGQFEDASAAAGLTARTFMQMGWGALFVDVDNDGWLDIFFANGHLYPQVDDSPELGESYKQKNQLLMNVGGGKFKDVSPMAGSGMQIREASRGLAAADLDDDGDLDFVITNVDAVPTVLENQPQMKNHWAQFRLTKAGRNKLCIGARVTLSADGKRQIREVRSGGSFLSQSDLRASFGLGSYTGTVEVEVQLPGQGRWAFKGLPIDRLSTLTLDDAHRLKDGGPAAPVKKS